MDIVICAIVVYVGSLTIFGFKRNLGKTKERIKMYLDDLTYFMAIGYANFYGCWRHSAHVFARNYGKPVTIEQIMKDWKELIPIIPLRNPE